MISWSALATLVAVGLIAAIGESILPATHIEVRIYVITIVTSLFAEGLGFAPRVLWLVPLWAAALTLLGAHIYVQYGVLGVVAVVLVAAVLLAFTIFMGRMHERRRERKDLANKVRTSDLRGLNPIYDQAWDTLHEAVLCPRETEWTKALCEHNLKVARIAVPWLLDRNPPSEVARRLQRVIDTFAAAAADPASVSAGDLTGASSFLQDMIRSRDLLHRVRLI